MKVEKLQTLFDGLSAELRCLDEAFAALELQAAALRTVDVRGLDDCVQTLTQITQRQAQLAKVRPGLLAAVAGRPIERLSELAKGLGSADALRVAEIRARLAGAAARVATAKARNRAWAEAGQELVEGALRTSRHRLVAPTYGATGRLRGGAVPPRLSGRG